LALLRSGCTAQETLAALVASTGLARWRQLAVLDAAGNTAAYSGGCSKPEVGEATARDACAIGNILANPEVPAAMLRRWQTEPQRPLAARLLQALEAGLAAGGEHQPVRSAHLLVVHADAFPLIDLRVDWHDQPIGELGALWKRYEPQVDDYRLRALDPDDPSLE
jgi:uncharacterized Ntn-hydrolase superfamily protein